VLNSLRPRERSPRRLRRGVFLLPSLFTLGNLFCGYACIVYTMRGEYGTAAPFIGLAVVLDMLDGRIARLTGSTSPFGVEFDSLADVVSFGLAPALLAFSWGLTTFGRLGWTAGFIYVAAAAIRLARFNIQGMSTTDKRYFAGLPSPAAAAVPASTVFAYPYGLHGWYAALAMPVVLVPAFLMVSTIRYRGFKTLGQGPARSYRKVILMAIVLAAIATHPQATLVALAYSYLLSAFVGMAFSRLRRRSAPGSADPEPLDADAIGTPSTSAGPGDPRAS
jgi:CDP-diacylglycerol--serine O-phosphatidyltransferase